MCLIAVRAPWVSGSPKIIVVPGVGGFQSVNLNAGGGSTSSAVTLGGAAAGAAAVGLILFSILGLLARTRRRAWFAASSLLAVFALVVLIQVTVGLTGRAERSGLKDPHVRPPAVVFAYLGALIALGGSAVGAASASSSAVASLPEAAPEMPTYE